MSIGSDITPTPPTVPDHPGADDAEAWRERELAILSELAEAGLEIALALKTRIVETAAADPGTDTAPACVDLARAFDRASRATRMSIALRQRLLKDAPFGHQAARAAARESRDRQAGRVLRIVRRVAQTARTHSLVREAMDKQARETLFDPDITGDLAGRPIGALVAQICADLGIAPSWLAMAQEAWAQEEIAGRPPGSPYAAWPDLPPDPDPPDPEDWDPEDWDPEDGDSEDGDSDHDFEDEVEHQQNAPPS
jgi:hypothetical protein